MDGTWREGLEPSVLSIALIGRHQRPEETIRDVTRSKLYFETPCPAQLALAV